MFLSEPSRFDRCGRGEGAGRELSPTALWPWPGELLMLEAGRVRFRRRRDLDVWRERTAAAQQKRRRVPGYIAQNTCGAGSIGLRAKARERYEVGGEG